MAGLRLEVRDFHDLTSWRWVLTDAAGTCIADHEVRLDATCWQYEAFTDLLGYLSWHVAPDQRARDEARIVGELGAWIGAHVLGPVAAALAQRGSRHGPRDPAAGSGLAGVPSPGARARGRQAARRPGRHAGHGHGRQRGPQATPIGEPAPRARPVQPPRGRPAPQPAPRAAGAGQAHRADRRQRQGRRRPGPAVRRDPRPPARRPRRGRGLGHHPHLRPRRPRRAAAGDRRGHARPGHRRRTGRPPRARPGNASSW